ncbi:Uncharacterised protein [Kingella potus]|uniref:Uncharacterized protein n=1 Tax=Kingella potus TaxID=265175 RepID=A0A377R2N7_9NEIS|nr:hypothetical protein [Kingella potus]STR03037.1 Uncharacterised protein [Kingella potus]STR03074.1 Uncharacterised protein [Kingella potus]
MISTYGASREQAERFVTLYRAKAPIRAAAHEAGISIIQATMIAQASGILRLTEGFIVNSRGAEIGRIGESLFARHLPEAVNTNLSVQFNNPAYDFILNGAKIDVKSSAGFNRTRDKDNMLLYRFRCPNKFETDLFVFFVKPEAEADETDEDSYTHCFIIPSLFLLNHKQVEVSRKTILEKRGAWSEFLFPVSELRDNILMLTASPQHLAVPPELREAAEANQALKDETNHAKSKRNLPTA